MDRRLAEVLEANAAARRRVVAGLEGVSQAAADWRPAPDAWSLGEIAHHVILAEESMRAVVEKSVARQRAGKRFEPMPDAERALSLHELLARRNVFAAAPFKAPESLTPTRGRAVGDLVFELERGATVTRALFAEQDVELMRALTCPHRLFGLLTLFQWMAVVGMHDADHADQMARVRAHPDFPK